MYQGLQKNISAMMCVLKHLNIFKSETIVAPTFKKITDNSDKNC